MRKPAVAGQFYYSDRKLLESQLSEFFEATKRGNSRAIVAPHAGYMYSGKIAAYAYASLGAADTYILLGPNHSARLQFPLNVSTQDWQTPLGIAKCDTELAKKIIGGTEAEKDEAAHLREHSLEVQLPFLQHSQKQFEFVPVSIGLSGEADKLKQFGENLAGIISSSKKKVNLVASSDFSHFISEQVAKGVDLAAIRQIEQMDAGAFIGSCAANQLSICGAAPIAALLYCLKKLGIKKGELLQYGTSADTTGDTSNVVGYAAIKFE